MNKVTILNRFAMVEFSFSRDMLANGPALRKAIVETLSDIPKAVYEKLNVQGLQNLLDSLKTRKRDENTPTLAFSDCLDSFKRWIESSKTIVETLNEEDFVSARGRDYSGLQIMFLGAEKLVTEHLLELVAGSKLGELIVDGIPGGNNKEDANAIKILVGQIRKLAYEACEVEALADKAERAKKETANTEPATVESAIADADETANNDDDDDNE